MTQTGLFETLEFLSLEFENHKLQTAPALYFGGQAPNFKQITKLKYQISNKHQITIFNDKNVDLF